jgi:hypothetical protein
MSGTLKASLVLSLNDQLTAALQRFKSEFNQLKQIGQGLSLGKLGNGADVLRSLGRMAREAAGDIGKIGTAADHAWNSLKRMTSAVGGRFGKALGEQSRAGVFAGAVEGYSVIKPIQEYAGYENTLRHTAITEKLTGPAVEAEVARLTKTFRNDALETGQSSESIAKAYVDLLQAGLKKEVADQLIGIHSRAATAYNISPEALGPAVFALSDSFKIGDKDMPSALAAMAMASKEGRFKVEDFSRFLPMIGGQMGLMGMTGRKGADTAFAALETITRNSADPGSAATNFYDALRYITSPIAARSFAGKGRNVPPEIAQMMKESTGSFGAVGIDLPKMLMEAEKKGIDPLDAFTGKLAQLTKGKTFVEGAELLGTLLHNQQAGIAFMSLVAHKDEFLAMQKQLAGVNDKQVAEDFDSAFRAPLVQVRLFNEMLEQLTRRIGQGFTPVLYGVNVGLAFLLKLMTWLDEKTPRLLNILLPVIGGFLSFGAALAILGAVWKPLTTGLALAGQFMRLLLLPLAWLRTGITLLLPVLADIGGGLAALSAPVWGLMALIVALVAAFAYAAADIYENWGRFRDFFEEMWSGVKDVFWGFLEFLEGVFTLDGAKAIAGLDRMWHGLVEIFSGLWDTIRQIFIDFGTWVDGWTDGAMTGAVNRIKAAWDGLRGWFSDLWADIRKPFDDLVGAIENSAIFKLKAPEMQPGHEQQALPVFGDVMPLGLNGTITVQAEPGTQVTGTQSSDPNVKIQAGSAPPTNTGRVLGRP